MRTSLMLVAAVVFAASAALADGKKVDICHIPPGNPSAAHMISVGVAAEPAHLAHGDLGPAEVFACACPCVGQFIDCMSRCDEDDTECSAACATAEDECIGTECSD